MFCALADQLFDSHTLHADVRATIVQYLLENKQWYSRFVSCDFAGYCGRMSELGTWGDHVCLQAAADFYEVSVNLVTSKASAPIVEIPPRRWADELADGADRQTIWLSYHSQWHYNSVYTREEYEASHNVVSRGLQKMFGIF
eukprot:TRINITY_DN16170_c0_g1_i1.p1 TRINITY_DN16170_c0_g1~~TRINITY_DN16170_c0_g1_i1.p1  ORF type:complete len:142 (-),score=35.29 TRINITY_DN16170_c0_g1_i1:50-475(-)